MLNPFKITKIGLILLLAGSLALSTPAIVFSQEAISSEITVVLPISDSSVSNGDIVVSNPKGYQLATKAYDSAIYGVVVTNPAVSFGSKQQTGSYPVSKSGSVSVRVTSANGAIKTGSFITSSKTPGVGQLADKSGYVVGTALTTYSATDPKQIGEILVDVKPGYNSQSGDAGSPTSAKKPENLWQAVASGTQGAFSGTLTTLRYLAAVTVSAIAFAAGFWVFDRFGQKGLESLGRNPAASKTIGLGMALHFLIVLAVMALGLLLSYLILTL